jgi:predicted DCC family thiol-disulfide oxidoreductase YuxK
VRARDRAGRVLAIPSQVPGVLERYGLTRAAADRDAWAIAAGGQRFAGAAAVTCVLAALGGRWAALAAVLRLAPVAWAAARVYRWVAANRAALSRVWGTVPECARPGVHCQPPR